MKISIVIPCFNERRTLPEVIARLRDCGMANLEIIVVDDGSNDGSSELIHGPLRGDIHVVVQHAANRGKGAAIRSALPAASGDIIVIQDADLEYDPRELRALLCPLFAGDAEVVFGSRFTSGHRRGAWLNYCYNRIASALISAMTRRAVSDYATGYKAFRSEVLRSVSIRADGFAVDAELALKVMSRHELRLREEPISYRPRRHDEGKKIRWWHAVESLAAIIGLGVRLRLRLALGS